MPAPRQPLTAGQRRNAYGARCRLCGGDVAREAGWLEGSPGAWTVIHEVCPQPTLPPTTVAANTRMSTTSATGTQTYNVAATNFNRPVHRSIPALISDVPAGHYAVPSETGNNDLDFFRVDRPTEGRYAGRIYVKRVIGGRPAQRIGRVPAQRALDRIAEHGVGTTARLYGAEIGRCYRCNRHLTDQTSRALGIGPDCRRQHGEIGDDEPWPVITAEDTAEELHEATVTLRQLQRTVHEVAAGRGQRVVADGRSIRFENLDLPSSDELNIIGGQTEDPLVSELGTGELL